MRNAHITKRTAPQGYVAVTKPLAQLIYDQGHPIVLAGNNTNVFHLFCGWCLSYTVSNAIGASFDAVCNSHKFYLEPELGHYQVFYVREQDVPTSYTVIVGNIGTVYAGNSRREARRKFAAYRELSNRNVGRAAGESVTLLHHGEPIREYSGTIEGESI